jgi:hypothetical protein
VNIPYFVCVPVNEYLDFFEFWGHWQLHVNTSENLCVTCAHFLGRYQGNGMLNFTFYQTPKLLSKVADLLQPTGSA